MADCIEDELCPVFLHHSMQIRTNASARIHSMAFAARTLKIEFAAFDFRGSHMGSRIYFRSGTWVLSRLRFLCARRWRPRRTPSRER